MLRYIFAALAVVVLAADFTGAASMAAAVVMPDVYTPHIR